MVEGCHSLETVLGDDRLQPVPLLVLAHKADAALPGMLEQLQTRVDGLTVTKVNQTMVRSSTKDDPEALRAALQEFSKQFFVQRYADR